jgi:hypothetical protein
VLESLCPTTPTELSYCPDLFWCFFKTLPPNNIPLSTTTSIRLTMATKSSFSYTERAARTSHPLVKKLFEIAEAKKSNVTISADIRNTKDLLALADRKSSRSPHHVRSIKAETN